MKIFYTLLCAILLLGCVALPDSKDRVATYGYVVYIDLEGGFYGIVSEGGTQYKPSNLQPRFRKDNERIYFEGTVGESSNGIGIQMWGKPLFITKISKE